MKVHGGEHNQTILAANNYATALFDLRRFKQAKSVLRKLTPVARRVLGENDSLTLSIRHNFATVLYRDEFTLDDLRVALTTLEETAPTARRVLGVTHPLTAGIDGSLPIVRAALRARETPSPGSS